MAKEAASKYPIEELRGQARELFGVGPEVVDGTVYGQTKTEYTVAELKKLIEDFLGREAK